LFADSLRLSFTVTNFGAVHLRFFFWPVEGHGFEVKRRADPVAHVAEGRVLSHHVGRDRTGDEDDDQSDQPAEREHCARRVSRWGVRRH
jgi:hypothetical protein